MIHFFLYHFIKGSFLGGGDSNTNVNEILSCIDSSLGYCSSSKNKKQVFAVYNIFFRTTAVLCRLQFRMDIYPWLLFSLIRILTWFLNLRWVYANITFLLFFSMSYLLWPFLGIQTVEWDGWLVPSFFTVHVIALRLWILVSHVYGPTKARVLLHKPRECLGRLVQCSVEVARIRQRPGEDGQRSLLELSSSNEGLPVCHGQRVNTCN